MKQEVNNYIDEAVNLELNVSRLYFRFYELFPEDADFWWKLTLEEKNHAALLENLKHVIRLVGNPPGELMALRSDDIKNANSRVQTELDKINPDISRSDAFSIAIMIEESAGEIHYQAFIDDDDLPKEYRVFQKLNMDDKDHAESMRSYAASHNIILKK